MPSFFGWVNEAGYPPCSTYEIWSRRSAPADWKSPLFIRIPWRFFLSFLRNHQRTQLSWPWLNAQFTMVDVSDKHKECSPGHDFLWHLGLWLRMLFPVFIHIAYHPGRKYKVHIYTDMDIKRLLYFRPEPRVVLIALMSDQRWFSCYSYYTLLRMTSTLTWKKVNIVSVSEIHPVLYVLYTPGYGMYVWSTVVSQRAVATAVPGMWFSHLLAGVHERGVPARVPFFHFGAGV